MGENVRLGRVAGIPVGMNWSLLVVFVLITLTLAEGFSATVSGYPDVAYWLVAITATLLFYACLLAHELAHSVVARRAGVPVHGITLWLFGGVSQLGGEAANADDLLRIALAGPLMSVTVGLVLSAVAVLVAVAGGPGLLVVTCGWLGGINLFLALFNLAPAAPLDGGRVLAALLWRRHGDRVRAAVSATRAGMTFGYVLIAVGVLVFLAGGGIGGLWFVFLGWFLLSAGARREQSRAAAGCAGRRQGRRRDDRRPGGGAGFVERGCVLRAVRPPPPVLGVPARGSGRRPRGACHTVAAEGRAGRAPSEHHSA